VEAARPVRRAGRRNPPGESRTRALRSDPYTHFTATKGISVSVVEDMISRKWIDTIVSVEETSTQIQVLFTNALEREALG